MSNWIKCSDRMPELAADVLITYKEYGERKQCVAYMWRAGYRNEMRWVCAGTTGSDLENDFEYGDVTHWMPLPEPPSEEE